MSGERALMFLEGRKHFTYVHVCCAQVYNLHAQTRTLVQCIYSRVISVSPALINPLLTHDRSPQTHSNLYMYMYMYMYIYTCTCTYYTLYVIMYNVHVHDYYDTCMQLKI